MDGMNADAPPKVPDVRAVPLADLAGPLPAAKFSSAI